jgi:hypothetical protein
MRRAGLHLREVASNPVDLHVHGLRIEREAIHGFCAGFAMFIDFVLNLFEEKIEFFIEFEK